MTIDDHGLIYNINIPMLRLLPLIPWPCIGDRKNNQQHQHQHHHRIRVLCYRSINDVLTMCVSDGYLFEYSLFKSQWRIYHKFNICILSKLYFANRIHTVYLIIAHKTIWRFFFLNMYNGWKFRILQNSQQKCNDLFFGEQKKDVRLNLQ